MDKINTNQLSTKYTSKSNLFYLLSQWPLTLILCSVFTNIIGPCPHTSCTTYNETRQFSRRSPDLRISGTVL